MSQDEVVTTTDPTWARGAAHAVLEGSGPTHDFGHTNHLHVRVDGDVLVDEHQHGPVVNDVFSVTKTVLGL